MMRYLAVEARCTVHRGSRTPNLQALTRSQKLVRSAIDTLREKPGRGTELSGELAGFRSLRVRRYRVIYKMDREAHNLEIFYVGHRRDVYETLQSLLFQRN